MVLIGAVRLAVSLLRFVRRHRGLATRALVQEWISGGLEGWADEGGWWTGEADAGSAHHPEPSHHADHSHH